MIILLLFSFFAGIVTVLSPCVLPVLPALLSAGGGKGHLRPIGIIAGLIISFTFFTLALTALVHITGISPDVLRTIAVALIAGFGLLMIFPTLGEKFAEWTSGVASLGQSVQSKSNLVGSGFWSGFILGVALGLVWTPCAGPILAAITTLAATNALNWSAFFITLAYSFGAAIPMFLIIYGGKKMLESSRGIAKYSEWIRKGFGVLMILAAWAIAFHYDVKFQQLAIQYVPLINIENNTIVKQELDKLNDSASPNSNKAFILPDEPPVFTENTPLPEIAKAPDFVGITTWINAEPLTMEKLKGKVVLIDFWTYSCINCIRTFPYLKDWYQKYKDKGLVIVGVHTPEFAFEKDPENVKNAVKRFELSYPVAVDSNFKTWQNYNNRFWPAHYLIDQKGMVRGFHFGEGAYLETENQIRSLLGLPYLKGEEKLADHKPLTEETYLGSDRAHSYDPVEFKGKWLISPQKATSAGDTSSINLNFTAGKVYLVMDSPTEQLITVLLDGRPLDKKYYTQDMNTSGQIIVKEPRKYDVIDLKEDYGKHTVTLNTPEGVAMYAFTFGN